MSDHLPMGEAEFSAAHVRVIDAAIVVSRAYALHEVTAERVARQAGVSPDRITELFPVRDSLLVATLEVWNTRRLAPLLPAGRRYGAVAFLRAVVAANLVDPGLMRLLSATAHLAATPAHPMAVRLQQDWYRFFSDVQDLLAGDIAAGREPHTMDPAIGAEQLIALYEGLQLQSMARPDLRVLDSFDRAVSRLRSGWSTDYVPPTWRRPR